MDAHPHSDWLHVGLSGSRDELLGPTRLIFPPCERLIPLSGSLTQACYNCKKKKSISSLKTHLGKNPRLQKIIHDFCVCLFFWNIRLTTTQEKKSFDIGKNKKSNANQSLSQSMKAVSQGPSALRSYRQTTETWSLRIIRAQTARSNCPLETNCP